MLYVSMQKWFSYSFLCGILKKRISLIQKEEDQQYFAFFPQSIQAPKGKANRGDSAIFDFKDFNSVSDIKIPSSTKTQICFHRGGPGGHFIHVSMFARVHLILLKGTDAKPAGQTEQVCVVLVE